MKMVFGWPKGLLVLAVLAAFGVVGLASCGGPEPTPTRLPPTATSSPPTFTATAVPPSPTATPRPMKTPTPEPTSLWGDPLPFETIERGVAVEPGGDWEAPPTDAETGVMRREAGFMVITAPENLGRLADLVSEEAQDRLRQVDWSEYFVVAIFLDRQDSGHEGVEIQQVFHRSDIRAVSVSARAGSPTDDPRETVPYHVVQVQKVGNWEPDKDDPWGQIMTTFGVGLVGLDEKPMPLPPIPYYIPPSAPTPPAGDSLPFETIERTVWARSEEQWETRESGLIIIASSEDLARIGSLPNVSEAGHAWLRRVDFDDYFVVAVYLGRRGGHEGIQIERVVRRGDEVSVYVRVGGRSGELWVTEPYHVIKVRKEGDWGHIIQFTLHLDGEATTSLSHLIP